MAIGLAVLLVFSTAHAGFAGSSRLTTSDDAELSAAWTQAANLIADLIQASGPAFVRQGHEFFCFASLIEQLLKLEADLRVASQMVQVVEFLDRGIADDDRPKSLGSAAMMVADGRDTALGYARIALRSAMGSLPSIRKVANTAIGACPTSLAVNTKAQAVIELVAGADSRLRPIAYRLGH